MPPAIATPSRPTVGKPAIPIGNTRARVADLKPLDVLDAFARAAPDAEQTRDELILLFKAGQQPDPAVVHRSTVLWGRNVLLAAKAAGVDEIEVRAGPGCDGLNTTDLGLMAAKFYLEAVRERVSPHPFDLRLIASRVYAAWVLSLQRRRPSHAGEAEKRKREDLRQRLIKEAFGRAQRSLERDVIVDNLPPVLQDAVRDGRLPARAIEPAEKLPVKEQKRLADMLANGDTFAYVEVDFFGASGKRRKTDRGACRAISQSIHVIVEEARDRADRIPLLAEDRPAAREAIEYLSQWVAAPLPVLTPEDIAEIAAELGLSVLPSGGDVAAVSRGDRRAKGGRT